MLMDGELPSQTVMAQSTPMKCGRPLKREGSVSAWCTRSNGTSHYSNYARASKSTLDRLWDVAPTSPLPALKDSAHTTTMPKSLWCSLTVGNVGGSTTGQTPSPLHGLPESPNFRRLNSENLWQIFGWRQAMSCQSTVLVDDVCERLEGNYASLFFSVWQQSSFRSVC
jgi:hypothetical protein